MTALTTLDALARVPAYGAGLGFRNEIAQAAFDAADRIDFVEITADDFVFDDLGWRRLERICERFRVIAHGTGLSIGSVNRPDRAYLQKLKRVCAISGSPYYSEHLAMTRSPGLDIGYMAPVWYEEETLERLVRNVGLVQDALERPLVLETISYFIDLPHATMSQTEFFHRLVERTDCGVLLDVTNIYMNAANMGFDAEAFLRAMPLEHVVQVHIAGGHWDAHRGMLLDSHSAPVQEESWALLQLLASLIPIKGVVLEHDWQLPAIGVLLDQVDRIRTIIAPAPAA